MIDNQYNEQVWKPSSASGCFYYTAKHLSYDDLAFLRDFAESGLDELGFVWNRAVKKSILTGVNYVLKAVTLAEQETGCTPNQVSEAVWEKIACKLDL